MSIGQVLSPILPFSLIAILAALLFILFLLLFRFVLGGLNRREIRRAMAITVVCFYFGSIASAISGVVTLTDEFLSLIDGLNKAFIVVVSFYFGSRTVEKYLEMKYPTESAGEHRRKEDEGKE
ncbi:hypothetical protein [Archaeoglobus neptunius]|uniref:hypothetical protein n=1 Tax=Archaeoglobus neptunius TaxID=2798580 RepID=UPI001927B1E9|nr:hypothetical protein [Archaeoglobus neptunius]